VRARVARVFLCRIFAFLAKRGEGEGGYFYRAGLIFGSLVLFFFLWILGIEVLILGVGNVAVVFIRSTRLLFLRMLFIGFLSWRIVLFGGYLGVCAFVLAVESRCRAFFSFFSFFVRKKKKEKCDSARGRYMYIAAVTVSSAEE
jgi:hypothetical protein